MNHADVLSPTVPVSGTIAVPFPSPSTILSPQHLIMLAAAADRIVPQDSEGPGGAEGGSFAYIVRHLEDGGNLVPFRAEYRTFLDALDADGFSSLGPTEQDVMLSQMEGSGTGAGRFFRSFAEHAQEGYYINPENWPSIGFRVTG